MFEKRIKDLGYQSIEEVPSNLFNDIFEEF